MRVDTLLMSAGGLMVYVGLASLLITAFLAAFRQRRPPEWPLTILIVGLAVSVVVLPFFVMGW